MGFPTFACAGDKLLETNTLNEISHPQTGWLREFFGLETGN
jgi:hypothetical protein